MTLKELAEKHAFMNGNPGSVDFDSAYESFMAGQNEWISVKDMLPGIREEKSKRVLIYASGFKIGFYFPEKFKKVEIQENEDYRREDYPDLVEDDENECYWLSAGFYTEKDCDRCDIYTWQKLNATHWKPLPESPYN